MPTPRPNPEVQEVTEVARYILDTLDDLPDQTRMAALISALVFALSASPEPFPLWESTKAIIAGSLINVVAEDGGCSRA